MRCCQPATSKFSRGGLDKAYSVNGRVLIKFCGDKIGRPVFAIDDLNNWVDGGGGGKK
jgi:hypothetical protein